MSSDEFVDSDLLQQVKAIIRRDLKLGPAAVIADDMAFFDSEADLDSLDILLLVTSVEKEFGIKIPSAEVGRAVFENPMTLTRYVDQLRAAKGAGVVSASHVIEPLQASHVLDRLPHREPFRFVSSVSTVAPGRAAEGVWNVTGHEAFFPGHFPGRPIVPGVLIAEALAQVAGLAGAGDETNAGSLVHVDVRFEQAVIPPASILLAATLTRRMGAIQQFDVIAKVGERVVARGSLALHLGGG